MIIERFFDLSALLLLAVILVGCHLGGPAGILPILGATLVFIGAPIAVSRLSPLEPRQPLADRTSPLVKRVRDGLHDTRAAFSALRSLRRTIDLCAISLLCWLLEAVLFLGAWIGLGGAPARWEAPMAAFTAGTLGTLVPGLPGHFGTFELFGLEAFAWTGVAPGMAAPVLLLAHLMLWAPTALFAIAWLPFARSGSRSGNAPEQTEGLLPQG
jgi:hypothetical protein